MSSANTIRPSSLALRLVSALVLAPVILGLTFLGGWAVYTLAAACLAISLREWAGMSHHGQQIAWRRLAFGVAYLFVSVASLVFIREQTDGAALFFYILFAVWLSDSFAYLFGKLIGGPKLAPAVSPNKTWAGLFGAMFGAAVGCIGVVVLAPKIPGVVVSEYFARAASVHMLVGAAIGVVGQAGDLMVSVFKRRAGLKDTGHLIPGHGGLLDRIDALLLVGLVFGIAMAFGRGLF